MHLPFQTYSTLLLGSFHEWLWIEFRARLLRSQSLPCSPPYYSLSAAPCSPWVRGHTSTPEGEETRDRSTDGRGLLCTFFKGRAGFTCCGVTLLISLLQLFMFKEFLFPFPTLLLLHSTPGGVVVVGWREGERKKKGLYHTISRTSITIYFFK